MFSLRAEMPFVVFRKQKNIYKKISFGQHSKIISGKINDVVVKVNFIPDTHKGETNYHIFLKLKKGEDHIHCS